MRFRYLLLALSLCLGLGAAIAACNDGPAPPNFNDGGNNDGSAIVDLSGKD